MPKDFRKKTFGKVLRGYAPDEVDDYIAYINEEYRKIERKNADNERKLAIALKKLEETQKSSDTRGDAAETANDTSAIFREAEEKAAEKAEMILAEARKEADIIREDTLAKAETEAVGVYKAASDMYDEICSFRDSLFELYNNHIESIENMTESAKTYINKVDKTHSEAGGAVVPHDDSLADEDEDEDDEYLIDEEDSVIDEEDRVAFDDDTITELDVTDEKPAQRDVYIDLSDDDDEFAYEDSDDDSSLDSPLDSPDDGFLRIDWKNRRVNTADDPADAVDAEDADNADDYDDGETRILDLRAVRDAAAAESDDFEEGEIAVKNFTFNLPDDDSADAETNDAETNDADTNDTDADSDIEKEFGDIDFLFTEDKGARELSVADEFDLVFSNSDTKKNIDEIRRQPTVAPNEPTNKKKHSKF